MMKNAKLFNSVNDKTRSHAEDLLKKYSKTIQEGWNGNIRILDVGCGDGSVTEILTRHIPQAQWSACDISSDMIDFAKNTSGHLGVEFFQMDITKELKQELLATFDCVFSLTVLNRIHDQRRALSNIHSLIKPKGCCLVTIVSDSELYDLDRRLANHPKWSRYMGDVEQLISPYHGVKNQEESLKGIMMECGFREVFVTTNKIDWPHNGISNGMHRNLVRTVDPCISKIPLQLHEEYLDCYFEMLADNRKDAPHNDYRYSILEVIAYK